MATFVLLYSDTGGGHRTAADSIKQAFHLVSGQQHRVEVVNAIGCLPTPFNRSEQTYRAAIRHARWLHYLSYLAMNGVRRMQLLSALLRLLDGKRLRMLLQKHPADVYVSCQPHFNPFVPPVMRTVAPYARYAHVVTDLSRLHRFHVTHEARLVTTPTEEARQELIAHGMCAERIVTTGQPVMPDLERRVQAGRRARARWGLRDDLLAVLILGGGEGMGVIGRIAIAIAESRLPVQQVVICGRNHALRDGLQRVLPRQTARVLGFVDDVPEWMGAADVLITKAGSTTLAEGFIAGLPIILFDALPGQEEGPRDYAVLHGAAAWCPTPEDVVAQLRWWLNHKQSLDLARRCSRALARPEASIRIAQALLELCP
ncbi:MAG: glycosyltransferase [Anaerolineae bacterium]|nr:hypothetical protein [Thermoflexales bacterium]MDW8394875.1 glycosyltransferase [Anaerolineae bacterium]